MVSFKQAQSVMRMMMITSIRKTRLSIFCQEKAYLCSGLLNAVQLMP